jgi:VWFA-related protein
MAARRKPPLRIVSLAFAIFLANALAGRSQTASTPKKNNLPDMNPAQELPPKSAATLHVQSPLVIASFTVSDPSGNYLDDLKQSDISVFDDGVRQRITHFGVSTAPLDAVIVVQTNDDAAPFLGSVRPLGPLFSGLLLGPTGKAAVLTYANKLRWAQQLSSNSPQLNESLQHLEPSGSKARLDDALAEGIRTLKGEAETARRVIIVFSDGADRGSATRADEIVRAASDANIQIYGIRFQPAKETFEDSGGVSGVLSKVRVLVPCTAPPGTPAVALRRCNFGLNLAPFAILALQSAQAELRANLLGQYAGYSGGVVYTSLKTRSIQDLLQQIALDINSQYSLTYVPSTLRQPAFHRIQIQASRPNATVRSRAGYFNEAEWLNPQAQVENPR